MTQKILLTRLGQLLRYWEDENYCAKMHFSVTEKFGRKYGTISTRKRNILPPEIGTELSEADELAREIPNYKSLRQHLENGTDFDPASFLPRVPKKFRNNFTSSVEYLEILSGSNPTQGLLLFPVFIKEWLKGKKVCEVANPDKIELVDLFRENFFSHLPYDCFILSLSKPLRLPHNNGYANPQGTYVCNFSQFVIRRDGDIVKILAIPDDIEKTFLSDEFKKASREIFSLSVKSELKKITKAMNNCIDANIYNYSLFTNCVLLRINISTSKEITYIRKFEKMESNYVDYLGTNVEDSDFWNPEKIMENMSRDWSVNALIPLINGIGKLFANYVPSEDINLYNFGKEENAEGSKEESEEPYPKFTGPKIPIVEERLAWNEVSAGNITFITAPKSRKKSQGVKIHTGREMPPHERRRHERHYRDKLDPSKIIKVVWVRQTTIRKDKLKTQAIHGSVSKYE